VIKRTVEVMKELGNDDPIALRKAGVVDLPTIPEIFEFLVQLVAGLFGGDSSSNAASYFANGLKGRPDEIKYEDHVEADSSFTLELPDGKGGVRQEKIPMRNAVNEVCVKRMCAIVKRDWRAGTGTSKRLVIRSG